MNGRRVATFIALNLVIAAGFGLWHLRSLRDSADGIAVKRLEHEQAYLAVLRDRLETSSEADLAAMASAFIAVTSINAVLAGIDGIHIPLQKPSGMTLDVQSVRTQFIDGFPEVVAKAHVTHSDSTVRVGVLLTLVLEPRVDDAHPNVLQLYVKPTGLAVDASLPALGALTASQVSAP
jgi:cobalamin synthase